MGFLAPSRLFIGCVSLLVGTLEASHSRAGVTDASPMQPFAVLGLVTRTTHTDLEQLGNQDHRSLLLSALQQAHYPVVDVDAAAGVALSLSGTVTEAPCEASGDLRCSIAIRWEVRKRQSQHVLYRVTTRSTQKGTTQRQVIEQLIRGSLQSLLKRPHFNESLRQGANDQGSSLPQAGFRDCRHEPLPMPGSAQTVLSATVLVESGDALGSGSIISPDGLVLTAHHLLQANRPLNVTLSSGERYTAGVARRAPTHDVALLIVHSKTELRCLPVRREPANVGDDVYAIGAPLGRKLSFSLTRGVVSGFRILDEVSLLQTDASVNPGNSGGALVDANGRLVGVIDFKLAGDGIQGLSFAVTATAALGSLRVHADATTAPGLLVPAPMLEPSASSTYVDQDDIASPHEVTYDAGSSSSHTAYALRAAGAITGALGIIGVATSWTLYETGKSSMRRSEFDNYQTINTISWGAFAAGASAFALSYLLPTGSSSKPATPQARRPRWRAEFGTSSVRIGGEF